MKIQQIKICGKHLKFLEGNLTPVIPVLEKESSFMV